MSDYFFQAIDNEGAQILFGALLLLLFAILLSVALFAGLLVRAIWRWLTCHTWNDVIVSTERKAFRTRQCVPARAAWRDWVK